MPRVPSLADLADIEACREAALRYSRGVDRLDPDEMRAAYWPEAVDEHGSFDGNAWEFVELCMTAHDRWSFTMHTVLNHTVELDADGVHARGEVYNLSLLRRAAEDVLDVWFGRYLDRYEKRDEEWRIIHRVCVHEGDQTFDAGTPMPIVADAYRQGSFDRRTRGRPLGP
jgi:hypothetical protein